MLSTRKQLKFFIQMDEYALGRKYCFWKRNDKVLVFQRILRKHEYYFNNKHRSVLHKLFNKYYGWRHTKLGYELGFDIPVNVFDYGLRINHWGLIVINPNTKVGAFCDIHQGVNIGVQGKFYDDCPIIGNNVWIGPGAKLFGKIVIADDCQIGANAVVNKSYVESGITIAGVPAKKISNNPNPYKRYIK